jgi:hypothetical protein
LIFIKNLARGLDKLKPQVSDHLWACLIWSERRNQHERKRESREEPSAISS